jgi:hypothetical protein
MIKVLLQNNDNLLEVYWMKYFSNIFYYQINTKNSTHLSWPKRLLHHCILAEFYPSFKTSLVVISDEA